MLTQCQKHEYYEVPATDHPGQLLVKPDGLPTGGSYTLINSKGETVGQITPGVAIDLEEGDYKVISVIPAANVEVAGTTVSLPTTASGEVDMAPDFQSSVLYVHIERDEVTMSSPDLQNMTRELVIKPAISGLPNNEIANMKLTLYGVANTANVEKGFGGQVWGASATRNANALFTTSVIDEFGSDSNFRLRLLGLDSSAKTSVGAQIVLKNGKTLELPPINVSWDSFNMGNPLDPAHYQLGMKIDAVTGTVTATIIPWKPGYEEELEGN
ncbi:hypothetical protein D0T85_15170 [Bacteroides sp. 519]|nr:hypothetical protein [Bacteroides sp. 519]